VTEANVGLVRRIHEAWDNKDSLDGMVAEDVEYVNPDYAVEPGIRRGHDSFRARAQHDRRHRARDRADIAVRFRWFASQREALNAVGIYD
jgi:hypothetical protein